MSNYIIEFIDAASDANINAYLSANSCTTIGTFDNFSHSYHVSAPAEPQDNPIVVRIIDDDNVHLELLGFTDTTAPTTYPTKTFDSTDDKNWWKTASIFAPDLDNGIETVDIRGAGVTVYVLDSGIELSHPEFENEKVIPLYSFTDTIDDHAGHGTAIASIIAGKTCGITDATVKVVKIFERGTPIKQSQMLAAFDAVINDFNANGKKPAVVNLSWNVSKNEFIDSKVAALCGMGMSVIVAAGNNGAAITDVSPASLEMVTTIGAYSSNFEPSNFSNYTGTSAVSVTQGETNYGVLDGWAPGEQIWAAITNGAYAYVAGTSFATAVHSAAVAYNASYMMNGDYYCDGFGEGDPASVASVTALSRENMLVLSAKYQGSVNKITTFKTHANDMITSRGVIVKVVALQDTSRRVFIADKYNQVKSDVDLPAGLSLSNGFLVGNTPDISTQYELHNIALELTKADGTGIDQLELNLYIFKSDFDKSTVVEGVDPILDVVLSPIPCNFSAGNYCADNTCTTTYAGTGCVSDAKITTCSCQ